MMQIATTANLSAVPVEILDALRRLIRRCRTVLILRGLCAVATVFLVSLLAVMAVDAAAAQFHWGAIAFGVWPRWAMTACSWAATLFTVVWFLIRPLARSFTLTGIARMIEQRHPELHERLSSAVELLTSPDSPELRGSEMLIAALAQEAIADARTVSPRREVSQAPVRPYLMAAGAVLVVLGLLFAVWPDKTARLLARAVAPNLNLGMDFDLRVIPGDAVVAAGDSFRVQAEILSSIVDHAELRRWSGPSDQVLDMFAAQQTGGSYPNFAITFRSVTESFRYRVHAGSQTSRYYDVTVVPRPTIRRIDVRYEYPAYTGRASAILRGVEGDIRAVAGTKVTVTVLSNTPLSGAELKLAGKLMPVEPEAMSSANGGTACSFTFQLMPKMKTQWGMNLASQAGGQTFRSGEMILHNIEAVADAPPAARILNPETARLRLKPTDSLPITYAVGDDFGLGAVDLLVGVGDSPVQAMPLAIPASAGKAGKLLIGQTSLDLSALKLGKARQVTFQLRSLDNLPKDFLPGVSGPQQGLSDLYTITIDAKAESFEEQMALAEEVLIREKLQAVLKDLKEARVESDPLRKTLEKLVDVESKFAARDKTGRAKDSLDRQSEAQAQRADTIVKKVGSADATVHELASQIAGGSFSALAERLTALSDNHISLAGNYAAQLKVVEALTERADLAKKSDFHIWNAIQIVEDMLKQLESLAAIEHKAEALKDLADRQNELADNKAAMEKADLSAKQESPEEKEWKKSEKDVAKDLAELVKKIPGALPAALKDDQKETKNLAAEARALAREQQKSAEDSQRSARMEQLDNEMKQLAAEQADLAKQAQGQNQPESAKPMNSAADEIKTGELPKALKDQKQAQDTLKDSAKKADTTTEQGRKANDLAQQAADVARQQKDLADHAAQAAKDNPPQAGDLKDTQKNLQQRAAEIAKEAAKAGPAAKEAADKNNPAPKMQDAHAAMEAAKDAKPAEAAQKAAEADRKAADAAKAAQDANRSDEVTKTPNSQKLAADAEKQSQAAQKQAQDAKAAAEQAKKDSSQNANNAAQAAKEAAEKADQLAKALQKASDDSRPAQADAQHSRELDQKQEQLRQRTQQLAEQRKALVDQQKSLDLARLKKEQADVAKKAAEMVDKVKADAPQHDNLETTAAAAAQKASEEINKPDVDEAAKDATEAAKDMDQLAKRLDDKKSEPSTEKAQGEKAQGEKPSGDKPSGEKPSGEKQPGENASGEKAQGEKSQGEKAQGEKPSGEMAQGEKAQGEKPSGEKASGEKTSGEKASGEKSAGEKSSGEKPSSPKPSSPQVAGSTAQEPDQVMGERPAANEQKKAELAEQVGNLAKRQDELAKEMAALAKGDLTAAAAQRQKELAEKTDDLKKDVKMLQDTAEELIPDSSARQEAANAGNELNQAEQNQQQAQQAMQQRNSNQAAPNQQQASGHLQQAAAALDRLGQALADAAAKAPKTPPDPQADDMAQAMDATDQAAASAKATDAEKAAAMLQALAAAAAEQADQAGDEMGNEPGQKSPAGGHKGKNTGKPSRTKDSKMGVNLMTAELDPMQLEKMGITLQDWARLSGKLQDEVLQAAGDDTPGEYRELVKRYFQEIAKRGNRPKVEEKK